MLSIQFWVPILAAIILGGICKAMGEYFHRLTEAIRFQDANVTKRVHRADLPQATAADSIVFHLGLDVLRRFGRTTISAWVVTPCIASLFLCSTRTAHADIVWSGDVSPADPSSWTFDTPAYIGRVGIAAVTVNGGSDLYSKYCNLGSTSYFASSVTIAGIGSTWTNSGNIRVGLGLPNSCSLRIEQGGQVTCDSGSLGDKSGSTGTATVTGAGSSWANSRHLYVGNYGTGTLNVADSGQVSASTGYLGYMPGSSGKATVTGNDSRWINSTLYVGSGGNGALSIEAGGQVSSVFAYIGDSVGSTSTVTVTGAGSTWINNSDLYVGRFGSGTLKVVDGGTVTTGTLYASQSSLLGDGTIVARGGVLDADLVFDNAHGPNQVIVLGSGVVTNLNLDGTGTLGAGYRGTGTLRIANGVVVTSSIGRLGAMSGSVGTTTVTGIGSTWADDGFLLIGDRGNGTLSIEAGGQVSDTRGEIGSYFGSKGMVTVTGIGSSWLNSDDLYVGVHGDGTLKVENGGTVSAKTLYASSCDLLGNGIISPHGVVLDGDLVFDNTHGPQQTTTFGTGGQLKLDMDGSGDLGAGYKTTGTLKISDGVVVPSFYGQLGCVSGAAGTATVSGAGSKWIISDSLFVGNAGVGELIIDAGGEVISPYCHLGYMSGSTAVASVSGSGSKWTSHGVFHIGGSDDTTLTVEAGGLLDTSYSNMGCGTVRVVGTGSKWLNNNTLHIGNGTLNIGNESLLMTRTLSLGSSNVNGVCSIHLDGTLQAAAITRGVGTTEFNWNDGTIQNYDASTDLTISSGLTLKLAATGTHAFKIDTNRAGIVDAVLSDATTQGTLTKTGAGTLTLSAANTYTGATSISDGTLRLTSTGLLASMLIDVCSGAKFDVSAKSGYHLTAGKTLQGSGTIVGHLLIDNGATHAPGNSPGIQVVQGNYVMRGNLAADIEGPLSGAGYDQVRISATSARNVTLGGALSLLWGGSNWSSDNDKLWIVQNDTTGTLSGKFSNYTTNGMSVGSYDGRDWQIFYGADSSTGSTTGGNDVMLVAVPEPSTIALLCMGALGLIGLAWRRRRS